VARQSLFYNLVVDVESLVSIDVNNSNFSRIDYARLLIITSTPFLVFKHHKVKINGQIYMVRLVEETWMDERLMGSFISTMTRKYENTRKRLN